MLAETGGIGRITKQAKGIPGAVLQRALRHAKLAMMRRKIRSGRLVAAAVIELEMEDGISPGERCVEGALDDEVGRLIHRPAIRTPGIPERPRVVVPRRHAAFGQP